MTFRALPPSAAWRHRGGRDGFEVVFVAAGDDGLLISGTTTAVEDDRPWAVRYAIVAAPDWTTRRAEVTTRTGEGERTTVLEHDGAGTWWVDGAAAAHLAGCLDVDLEASVVTNTLPVHRLALSVSDRADVPAAYVRALDLAVERLDQSYQRLSDVGDGQRYRYRADAFDFSCDLSYDPAGLVTEYPGLARRTR